MTVHTTDLELSANHIKKVYPAYMSMSLVVTVAELVMTIRGLLVFDLTHLKHQLYFSSYLFLFVFSLVTFLVLVVCRGGEKRIRYVVAWSYVYVFGLICWATLLSIIDCTANGDSGPIVFVMICLGVSLMFLVRPVYYIIMLAFCTAGLVVCCYWISGAMYSPGFYINLSVFFVQAVLMNLHYYRLNRHDFETTRTLTALSFTDQLTGIYNRRHLDEQVGCFAKRGEPYVFMLIDVDDFKQINDNHGHAVGDSCLVRVAGMLLSQFGELVYRLGGDEFAVIATCSQSEAAEKIDRINTALKHAFADVDLHLSVGIYQTAAGDTTDTIYIRADTALYATKRKGKGTWTIYDDKME